MKKIVRRPLVRNPVSMAVADGIGQMEVRERARQQVVEDILPVIVEVPGDNVVAEAICNAPDAMGKPL